MNRKAVVLILLTVAILAGAPESFALPQYFTNFTAVYGDGSCGTCHVNASGGGPRNSYGTLFENQPDHATDPGAALIAIGPPPSSTATPLITPTATMTLATTEVTNTTAPGFEIVLSLVGLFAMALLAKRHNK